MDTAIATLNKIGLMSLTVPSLSFPMVPWKGSIVELRPLSVPVMVLPISNFSF